MFITMVSIALFSQLLAIHDAPGLELQAMGYEGYAEGVDEQHQETIAYKRQLLTRIPLPLAQLV